MYFRPDKQKWFKNPFFFPHFTKILITLSWFFKCFLNLIFWLQQTLESFFKKTTDIFHKLKRMFVTETRSCQAFSAHDCVYCCHHCVLGFNASVGFNWLLPWLLVIFCFLFYSEITTAVSSTKSYFINCYFLSLLKGQLLIWYARAGGLPGGCEDFTTADPQGGNCNLLIGGIDEPARIWNRSRGILLYMQHVFLSAVKKKMGQMNTERDIWGERSKNMALGKNCFPSEPQRSVIACLSKSRRGTEM